MKIAILSILSVLFFQACSLNRIVIRQTATILDYGVLALYEETDLKLAEQAMASDIKLLEGLVKGDPENEHLLGLTAQALAGYALGFLEDDEPERAKAIYLRAREYGLRMLRLNDHFAENEKKPLDDFSQAVNLLDDDQLDALFWTAFAWGGWINLSLDDPRALMELPKVQVMMQRVLDLDERYFHGAAHLFFGSIWGTKPRMLGGDPEKAKSHFEQNLKITEGKFLLTYIYYARFYAAKTLDEELFDAFVKKVNETPAEVLPGFELMNMIAKKKALVLQRMKSEWF
ncbi:MAG: hypothetical protein E4H13_03270 [Calditrichales bacterium]|nr:MAG: hypothetical protein E4H13_03270 [Calditrichales bacterium]